MNAKTAVKFALLLFLAVAVVIVVRREIDGGSALVESDPTALPADGLVVVYFHGAVRCPTCQTIESYAEEAIATNYSAELANGQLAWRVLNYELPENARFVTEFEIVAPTVVLIRREAGEDAASENLTRVWELVGDKPSFVSYVAEEVNRLLR